MPDSNAGLLDGEGDESVTDSYVVSLDDQGCVEVLDSNAGLLDSEGYDSVNGREIRGFLGVISCTQFSRSSDLCVWGSSL